MARAAVRSVLAELRRAARAIRDGDTAAARGGGAAHEAAEETPGRAGTAARGPGTGPAGPRGS